jgi:anhydro-N-acetylmuramic acid kinase
MNFIYPQNVFAGVMTGTSLDGLDAVLADFSVPIEPQVLAAVSLPYPAELRAEMLALQMGSDGTGLNELHRSRVASIALSELHIQALQKLFDQVGNGLASHAIAGIGVHGQTVRHAPSGVAGSAAYTLQLIDPAKIAEAMQCPVVSDFRARDIAAGGQGAPLVPGFHVAISATLPKPLALVNIGGFANVTLLRGELLGDVQGFDIGPGNVLMDGWIQSHLSQAYDENGAWAATGQVNAELLSRLLLHPYFAQPLPKSTGREAFDLVWLQAVLQTLQMAVSPVDVQATVCELTALTIAQTIQKYLPTCKTLYVCGGGAFNQHLMQRLRILLTHINCLVETTDAFGVAPQQMEALAFAWLARQCLLGLPANVPSVTGAAGFRVLGSICSA